MPESWLYVAGGIIIGMLVFTIGYHLITVLIIQGQKQNTLSNFNVLYSDIESVCLQELGNSMIVKLKIPSSVRVIYATDDKISLPVVIDLIKDEEISRGKNLCLQFKTEQELRCQSLTCDITIPYMGALETYNDFQLMVNKILGKPLVKEYSVVLIKTKDGVEIVPTRCREEGEKCSLNLQCCSELYCWSGISVDTLNCHTGCAENGNFAINSSSCCSGYLNRRTKKCDTPPTPTEDENHIERNFDSTIAIPIDGYCWGGEEYKTKTARNDYTEQIEKNCPWCEFRVVRWHRRDCNDPSVDVYPSIFVRVIDENGVGISNIRIESNHKDTRGIPYKPPYYYTTDDNGEVQIRVPDGILIYYVDNQFLEEPPPGITGYAKVADYSSEKAINLDFNLPDAPRSGYCVGNPANACKHQVYDIVFKKME